MGACPSAAPAPPPPPLNAAYRRLRQAASDFAQSSRPPARPRRRRALAPPRRRCRLVGMHLGASTPCAPTPSCASRGEERPVGPLPPGHIDRHPLPASLHGDPARARVAISTVSSLHPICARAARRPGLGRFAPRFAPRRGCPSWASRAGVFGTALLSAKGGVSII